MGGGEKGGGKGMERRRGGGEKGGEEAVGFSREGRAALDRPQLSAVRVNRLP